VRVREAGDRVEEELLAFVGVLKVPGFTAVSCFVDAGFFTFAAGHRVSGGGVESDDAAEIERVAARVTLDRNGARAYVNAMATMKSDYDQREALAARSPYNVVHIDLPVPAREGGDPYERAARLLASWRSTGAVVRDDVPALWELAQEYRTPDGAGHVRRGLLARVRVQEYGPGTIRPHERTHPGPREDRLRLTRATKTNLSPIFSLYSDPEQAAWRALAPSTEQAPWGEVSDSDGTTHRIWRVSDTAAIEAVQRIGPQTRLGAFRDQVAERRGRNQAKVAAARELLECVFYGLRDHHIRRLAA